MNIWRRWLRKLVGWIKFRLSSFVSYVKSFRPAKVTVATFRICHCELADVEHLLVGLKSVPLQISNVVAISYTWGEFEPRRPVTIGHMDDGKLIEMQLGQEWAIEDLIRSLARICRGHSRDHGVWIDQLCLPQDNKAERRKAIMQIPNVYRTFKTVVLMCGKPCGCFRLGVALYIIGEQTGLSMYRLLADKFDFDQARICYDHFGASSYFDRLWTQQEFIYSTHLSVVWCSPLADGFRCINRRRDVRNLSKYAQLVLQREQTNEKGRCELKFKSTHFISAGGTAIGLRKEESWRKMLRAFLLGHPLERSSRKKKEYLVENDFVRLQYFLSSLCSLSQGAGSRSATEACDYVAAVWIECPRYQLPVDYKSRAFPDLLEDAVMQLERNFGHTPMVSFPAELSGDPATSQANHWRPSTYVRELSLVNANTIYGPLMGSAASLIALNRDFSIQWNFVDSIAVDGPSGALSSNAVDYPKTRVLHVHSR